MGLRVIQYRRQNYFSAVEECPLLMETNPYQLIQWWWEKQRVSAFLWDSWSPLPALACRGVLFQERNGGNVMTRPRKENQVSVLSFSFFWNPDSWFESAQWNRTQPHLFACTHSLTYWQALATSQKPVVAFLDRLQGDCSAEKQHMPGEASRAPKGCSERVSVLAVQPD